MTGYQGLCLILTIAMSLLLSVNGAYGFPFVYLTEFLDVYMPNENSEKLAFWGLLWGMWFACLTAIALEPWMRNMFGGKGN